MEALRPWISRTLVAYVVLALVLATLGWRLAGESGGRSQPANPPEVEEEVSSASAPSRLTVHVAGAVVRPGVYRLPIDSRVEDALRRAGGAAEGSAVDAINLAAPLTDGQQVVVPGPGSEAEAGPLSLSRATSSELEELDGIGPALAARIIEWRQRSGGFASVDQLSEVSGFGSTRVEALRPHVVP